MSEKQHSKTEDSAWGELGALERLSVITAHIEQRREELLRLNAYATKALSVLHNLSQVNAEFEKVGRQDLVMNRRASMMSVHTVEALSQTNNFAMNMKYFGVRASDPVTKEYGHRLPSSDELKIFQQIGGHYRDFEQRALAAGLNEDTTHMLILNSHLATPAFMRMWVVAPELTEDIMSKLFQAKPNEHREELFVAYNIMSQLVDEDDPYVRVDDCIDSGYLCR
ncbi:MAG: hypothetical protein KDD62_04320 [Bdellovibrionales bacterium]|nr:hypothetical protein [Bdellovibrionales bacterium]